ncbi:MULTISPECIES: hypothetical protein [unclassified Microbacterium]|uniref:hypothetical protein n=1 Tax=unclassified Microbacterium TaxID=2609290 RepID=UPI0030174B9A
MTHPYFVDKAREAFAAAGGDPDAAGPLAAWAEAARGDRTLAGVIVALDGTIIAETTRSRGSAASATYVRDAKALGLLGSELGIALGQLTRSVGQPVVHITTATLTQGHSTPPPRALSDMTAAEVRAILEMTGHGDDTDAMRALSKSRSMIQKLKAGTGVTVDVADRLRTLQDDYADARDTALTAAPTEMLVWKGDDNDTSWAETGRPARWHRMIAAECYQEHGTRIRYHEPPTDNPPW